MNKREAIKERRRQRQRQQRMVTIMVVSGVALIIAALLMLPTIRSMLIPLGSFAKPEFYPRPMASANTMGDPDAPVVIEEFSDFGCNHCAAFSEGTAKQIVENYVASGDVHFIFRSTGNLLNNPSTIKAAEAAYCAGDQNKFWEYHDLLFANQINIFYTQSQDIERYFDAFAESLELDLEEFNACYDGRKYQNQVQNDEVDARSVGITGTPGFLINGTVAAGALPYDEFVTLIEGELAKASY